MPGIPGVYVRLFCDVLRELGHDDVAILDALGLDRAALLAPDARVAMPVAARVAELGLRLAGHQGLGFRYAAALKITLHGSVGLLASSSLTIGEALEAATRFLALRAPFLEFVQRTEDDVLLLEVRPLRELGAHRALIMEAMLMGLVYMVEQLHEGAAGKTEVFMTGEAPAYYARLAALLPAPVRYGATSCVVRYPTTLLDGRPWLADPAVAALAREQCEAEFDKLFPNEPALVGEVRRRVAATDPGAPTLDAVAKALGLSPRTLRRRLEEEGRTYKELVEAALRERCTRLLAETDAPVSEVAFRAGYNDVSNFTRAFRRWTGKTPRVYRRDARAAR